MEKNELKEREKLLEELTEYAKQCGKATSDLMAFEQIVDFILADRKSRSGQGMALDEEQVYQTLTKTAEEIWRRGGNLTAYTFLNEYAKAICARFRLPQTVPSKEDILDVIDHHECHHGVPRAVYASEFDALADALLALLKAKT